MSLTPPEPSARPEGEDVDAADEVYADPALPSVPTLPGVFSEPPESDLEPPSEEVGLLAERYSLLDEIGRGGIGVVHKALDTRSGETVAIKFLHDDSARDGSVLDRLLNEVQLVRKLRHPHICQLLCLSAHEGRPFLAMEILRGPDLSDYLAQQGGRLPPEEVLRMLGPIAEALDQAHQKRVVHLDVKPQNMKFTRAPEDGGVLKILDFGLARAVSGGGSGGRPTKLGGSRSYRAPEQAKGGAPRPACDVYAFAVTVYELLAGAPPFGAEEYKESREPPLIPGAPSRVRGVFLRALSPKPKRRYPTVQAFMKDLEAAYRGGWGPVLVALGAAMVVAAILLLR